MGGLGAYGREEQPSYEEEGRTRLKDRFVISPPVAGVLCRIELEAGDPVEEGQVLALLEPLRSAVLDPRSRARAQAQVAAAQASLRLARENVQAALADAEFAAAELERLKALHQRGMITREALERAEAEARRTQANRRSAEFAVEKWPSLNWRRRVPHLAIQRPRMPVRPRKGSPSRRLSLARCSRFMRKTNVW